MNLPEEEFWMTKEQVLNKLNDLNRIISSYSVDSKEYRRTSKGIGQMLFDVVDIKDVDLIIKSLGRKTGRKRNCWSDYCRPEQSASKWGYYPACRSWRRLYHSHGTAKPPSNSTRAGKKNRHYSRSASENWKWSAKRQPKLAAAGDECLWWAVCGETNYDPLRSN